VKIAATILCLYLFGLHLQPALFFSYSEKKGKKMACCLKKDAKEKKHTSGCNGGDDDGCCDGGKCNPFFSQCPLCAATAIAAHSYFYAPNHFIAGDGQTFFIKSQAVYSQYLSDILHPPQV
jgi:hypothetical protein